MGVADQRMEHQIIDRRRILRVAREAPIASNRAVPSTPSEFIITKFTRKLPHSDFAHHG